MNKTLTLDMIKEAEALLLALAPKKAPEHIFNLTFPSGLRVMKNDLIPNNTIMLSTELFDLVYYNTKEVPPQD